MNRLKEALDIGKKMLAAENGRERFYKTTVRKSLFS